MEVEDYTQTLPHAVTAPMLILPHAGEAPCPACSMRGGGSGGEA